jgi:hypothetical protein
MHPAAYKFIHLFPFSPIFVDLLINLFCSVQPHYVGPKKFICSCSGGDHVELQIGWEKKAVKWGKWMWMGKRGRKLWAKRKWIGPKMDGWKGKMGLVCAFWSSPFDDFFDVEWETIFVWGGVAINTLPQNTHICDLSDYEWMNEKKKIGDDDDFGGQHKNWVMDTPHRWFDWILAKMGDCAKIVSNKIIKILLEECCLLLWIKIKWKKPRNWPKSAENDGWGNEGMTGKKQSNPPKKNILFGEEGAKLSKLAHIFWWTQQINSLDLEDFWSKRIRQFEKEGSGLRYENVFLLNFLERYVFDLMCSLT